MSDDDVCFDCFDCFVGGGSMTFVAVDVKGGGGFGKDSLIKDGYCDPLTFHDGDDDDVEFAESGRGGGGGGGTAVVLCKLLFLLDDKEGPNPGPCPCPSAEDVGGMKEGSNVGGGGREEDDGSAFFMPLLRLVFVVS